MRNKTDLPLSVQNLSLVTQCSLNVDFPSKTLQGSVELDLERVQPDASELVLDTKLLKISSVTASGETLDYKLGDAHEVLPIKHPPRFVGTAGLIVIAWKSVRVFTGLWRPFVHTAQARLQPRAHRVCDRSGGRGRAGFTILTIGAYE